MKVTLSKFGNVIRQQLHNRKFVRLFLSLALIILLPLFIVLVNKSQDIRQRASANNPIEFVDSTNTPVTSTTTPAIKVKLTSPWNTPTTISYRNDRAVLAAQTATFQTNDSFADVNEVNGKLDPSYGPTSGLLWLGNGGSSSSSYTGLRFTRVTIPKNAKIISAFLQVYSPQEAWIGLKYQLAGEAVGNSSPFASNSIPSKRILTSAKSNYNVNTKWLANSWYNAGNVTALVQEIVSNGNWQSGNALSLILSGKGSSYGRKFVSSYDAGQATAPRLVVSYDIVTTSPSVSPTQAITTAPTSTIAPTAVPTPTAAPITTKEIILAEDSAFSKNMLKISPVSTNPIYMNYIFSDSSVGTKTIYAKFVASDGQEKIFSNTISLVALPATPTPTMMPMGSSGESMAMMAWRVGGKNAPNPLYDTCEDGTDIVLAHNLYYVVAYDGIKYPTWHPSVVTNPVTGVGNCSFGHEHGSNPQNYMYWNEIVQHFGKDTNGDGIISPLVISTTGAITAGDRAGLPFGIANDHMDQYYNQENRDSLFVRHEDHVGHKIEFVNNEAEMVGNTTHLMTQLAGTNGTNVPYYTTGSNTFLPTGVVCTHLHKFHQGTSSGDAIRNNLHEVIFHSKCQSVNVNNINAPAYYPNNVVLLTGMMAFGKPGEYLRFCFADRSTKVCPDGKNADGSCVINDPLISKLPDAINSTSLGRNMVDRYCYENWSTLNPGNNYFGPYELWEGDLRIQKADGDMLAEHGRQWDVLDPIRFVDPISPTGFSYNALQCAPGGVFDGIQYIGGCNSRTQNTAWDSPQSGFRGLKRTTYFGRNHVSNPGTTEIWFTDPLGGNAVATSFPSALKQRIATVDADIQTVQYRIQQLYGSNHFLNDRAIQRQFSDGNGTVHAPN